MLQQRGESGISALKLDRTMLQQLEPSPATPGGDVRLGPGH
jgi:hypothetical protein